MKHKHSEKTNIIILRVMIGLLCAVVAAVFVRSYYVKGKQRNIVLKSRYTFSVDIDKYGNVVKENSLAQAGADTILGEVSLNDAAKVWITEFIKQYTNRYLPIYKSVRKYNIEQVKVLDGQDNTVLISFYVILKNTASEYFSTWEGVRDDGKLKCEWVVSFALDSHLKDVTTVYPVSLMSSEAYGIAKYNEKIGAAAEQEETKNTSTDILAKYIIRDNILYVTYDDGANYAVVPVDCANLPYKENSTSELKDGSYMITTAKTAFLYGGMTNNGNKVPLTLVYSDNKGMDWTTCELDAIYTAQDYYVKYFDENTGVVVCGYGKTDNESESSKIYKTTDGGDSWTVVGSGPANYIIKGTVFVNQDVGFFCYNYFKGMESNLYMTRDGGKTFSKVTLEEQELDSTAARPQGSSLPNGTASPEPSNQLTWFDVYKDALVPVVDDKGVITIYLTQSEDGTYNDGKTAAKYQSADMGETWKYLGQLEISKGK